MKKKDKMMEVPTPPDNEEEFSHWLPEFISSVDYSELITVDGETPHIRPMIYVSEGLDIYMVTGSNSHKLEQIRHNPKVSVIIIKSLDIVANTQEVIISGKAEIIQSPQKREHIFKLFHEKPETYQEWVGKESEYSIIKINPSELKYFDYSSGESKPRTLTF